MAIKGRQWMNTESTTEHDKTCYNNIKAYQHETYLLIANK